MNMFRKIRGKHLYIVISFGIGIIFAIVGLCLKRNQTALSIYKIDWISYSYFSRKYFKKRKRNGKNYDDTCIFK